MEKTKHIVDRYDKKLVGTLPRALFPGRIIVVQSEGEAEKAVDYLLAQRILGFDTETRPNFKKGHMNEVALLQVSTLDTCFLFRLCRIGVPPCLRRLLASTEVEKVALSWKDDVHMLHQRCEEVRSEHFVELQEYVREFGIEDASLQKLYANIFGQRICKTQQLSNWEADTLSEGQKLYAATDAWACVRLYEELGRMQRSGRWELEVVPRPEQEQQEEKTV